MSPEAQRIAIAEACGYKLTPLPQNPNQKTWQRHGYTETLPDYLTDLTDLNACHEMEKTLTKEQRKTYVWKLERVTDAALPGSSNQVILAEEKFQLVHATAEQRAEAFLRTLGKWNPDA